MHFFRDPLLLLLLSIGTIPTRNPLDLIFGLGFFRTGGTGNSDPESQGAFFSSPRTETKWGWWNVSQDLTWLVPSGEWRVLAYVILQLDSPACVGPWLCHWRSDGSFVTGIRRQTLFSSLLYVESHVFCFTFSLCKSPCCSCQQNQVFKNAWGFVLFSILNIFSKIITSFKDISMHYC